MRPAYILRFGSGKPFLLHGRWPEVMAELRNPPPELLSPLRAAVSHFGGHSITQGPMKVRGGRVITAHYASGNNRVFRDKSAAPVAPARPDGAYLYVAKSWVDPNTWLLLSS